MDSKLDVKTLHDIATNPINPLIWISASAGTGKTKVLVDRVLRLLVSGKHNILCLTFTNAAVNEMTERIYKILAKWAIATDKELYSDIKKLLNIIPDYQKIQRSRTLFNNLSKLGLTIQTIHSFCYKLISSFPIETGISPNCQVIDFTEYYEKIFRTLLKNNDIKKNFHILALEMTENHIYDLLYDIISHMKNHPFNDKNYKDYILKRLEINTNTVINFYDKNLKILADNLQNGSLRDQKIAIKIHHWYSLPFKRKLSTIKEYAKIFIDLKLLQAKPISTIITHKTLNNLPILEEIIINEQLNLLKIIEHLDAQNIATLSSNLIEIAQKFIELYNQEKHKKGFIDYSDITYLALTLLTNAKYKDWILFHLDYAINHILIDEAQDNSLEQWHIITKLCDDFFSGIATSSEQRTLFIVGDVKQSIYSFQNARPDYFQPMKQYFMSLCQNYKSLELNQSFRSTKAILSLVDKVFDKLRYEISFLNNQIEHKLFRKKDPGIVEIWPLLKAEKKKKESAWNSENTDIYSIDSKKLLAYKISSKISYWLKTERFLTNRKRKISPKDIMILLRHRSSFIDYLIYELKNLNIPVVERDRFKILDYIIIQDLINLGEFLLCPENDLVLASVLKSPFFEFSEEDLFEISYERADKSLWMKLQSTFIEVADHLKELLYIAKFNTALELYTYILDKNKKKISSRLGTEYSYIIEEFINLLVQFEYNNTNSSLQYFIHWIKTTNPEIKNDVQNNNAVRIMTVHNAKGLQSPIVFLADTTTVPRNNQYIIVDDKQIPFCFFKYSNNYTNQLLDFKKNETYNEYLRLLYVAMTRAEDELYITGQEPINEKSWYNLIKMTAES